MVILNSIWQNLAVYAVYNGYYDLAEFWPLSDSDVHLDR